MMNAPRRITVICGDLKNAVHIGHSTGGGEVIRHVARYGNGRVTAAVIISAIPPAFMKSEKNPDGVDQRTCSGLPEAAANRIDIPHQPPVLLLA
jgi:non-heme chloroperoxidase